MSPTMYLSLALQPKTRDLSLCLMTLVKPLAAPACPILVFDGSHDQPVVGSPGISEDSATSCGLNRVPSGSAGAVGFDVPSIDRI